MKRKQIIQMGILVFALAVSGTASVMPVQAETAVVSEAEVFQEEMTAEEKNEVVISLLSLSGTDDFKTWDQSAATMTEEEAAEMKAFIEENIIQPGSSDYEKAQAIWTWIGENIKSPSADEMPYIRPYDVFTHKTAVCGGYSNLYKAMLNLEDIPAVLVYGGSSGGAHEWNLVYADGKWFHSDSTWKADYFDKGLAEFSKDHMAENAHGLKLAGENGTWIGYEMGHVSVVDAEEGITKLEAPEKIGNLPVTGIAIKAFKPSLQILKVGRQIRAIDVKEAGRSPQLREVQADPQNEIYASEDGVLFTKDFSELLIYPQGKTDERFVIPKETISFDNKETFTTTALKDIDVEAGNPSYSSYEGIVCNADKTEIVTIPEGKEKVKIPGTAVLDSVALNSKVNIKEVELEEGIKTIPDYTFSGSTGIVKLTLPASLEKIDEYAFGSNAEGTGLIPTWLTICAPAGSYAEQYAKENGIAFEDSTQVTPDPEEEAKKQAQKELNEALEEAEKTDLSLYEKEAADTFQKELVRIKGVAADEQSTTKDLQKALADLKAAAAELEEHRTPERPDSEDKEKEEAKKQLKEAAAKAEKIDLKLYKEEAAKTFKKELDRVKMIADDPSATTETLKKALADLNAAQAVLEKNKLPQEPQGDKDNGGDKNHGGQDSGGNQNNAGSQNDGSSQSSSGGVQTGDGNELLFGGAAVLMSGAAFIAAAKKRKEEI